jgi:hypothetical protein
MERLSRAGYFLAAVLLHLVVLLIVATKVVFVPPVPPADDFVKTYVPGGTSPPPPPPSPQETMPVPTAMAANPATVIRALNTPTAPVFNIPLPNLSTPTLAMAARPMAPPKIHSPNDLKGRLPTIRQMEQDDWKRSAENIRDSNGDPHNVVATFPVYLASYAEGDWGCNIHLTDDGEIDAGSIPNLVAKINEWSHGNIKGRVVTTPLAIGGPDLLAKKPPFIFFTGHKDFQLTDQEIDNLRNYLQDGGAIWGDNALAGEGSRFDIAFRREMKRVIPDIDKNFEEVPLSNDIYTKGWFPISKVPPGMNYYAEPLQHIDIDGRIAVLYTPNDYSDLFFMRILPGDTDLQTWYPTDTAPLYTNFLFWNYHQVFFRNFTLPGALEAQHLGMNIVSYLLVRFDKDLLLAP